MNVDQRQHFNLLYHGTGELIHELCEDDQYQKGMCGIVQFNFIVVKIIMGDL